MALIRTEAFVVKTIRFGETSAICRLFTPDRGVVPVIGKGARRPRSRFGARLEPFQRLAVTYYDKPGREIQTLSQVDRISDYPGIRASLERMEAAGAWFRFVRAAVPEHAPAEPLYRLAVVAVERLEACRPEATRRWETYHRLAAADLLGLAPRIEACAACGVDLPDRAGMGFSVEEGGAVCAACADRQPGAGRLAPREYAVLTLYGHPDYDLVDEMELVSSEEARIQDLVHRFISWHAGVAAPAPGGGPGR